MRRWSVLLFAAAAAAAALALPAVAQENADPQATATLAPVPASSGFDAELAKKTGADEYGMRSYVLVILKTGPSRVEGEEARKAMFAGHMANIERLADEGKLVLAGPFGKNEDGWRGLFVFATDDIEEAKALVATDPVIINGEMVAEYHQWYWRVGADAGARAGEEGGGEVVLTTGPVRSDRRIGGMEAPG